METTRPPGFPGNPPARMPRAPTPARSSPPRPLRGDDMAFRPTQDVGPRHQRISGLNHAAYGLPVNASRPGSPQDSRITRFRLAAGLGRMGLDTHRVSNKVSKITSRHLLLLDRASPGTRAGASIETKVECGCERLNQLPIAADAGRPSSVIRLRMLQASRASTTWASGSRARSRSPRIDLYRKKAFSTRTCRW